MDEHVKAYAESLGYRLENHPPHLTITELLIRRAECRAQHARSLEQYTIPSALGPTTHLMVW